MPIVFRKHAGTMVNSKRSVSSPAIQLRGSNPSIVINKKIVELGRNKAWKEILLIHQKEKKDLNNINYATIMSQLGRIRSVDCTNPSYRAFVADLANQIEVRGMKWVGAREAGNIIHTIGKMNLKSESAQKIVQFAIKEENAKWLVEEGNPQNIANTVWACATLGVESTNLFSQVDKHGKWLVEEGNPQVIANTVWAFATLGVEAPNLFSQVDKHSKWLVEEGNPQAIANTVWACATLGVEAPNFFSQVDKHAKWLVEEGNPQDIANTVCAFAKLGVEAPNLLSQVDKHAERLVKEGNPQAIANTVWACATLGVESPNLLSQVDKHAKWLVEEGNPQDIANTVWACATLGVEASKLLSIVDKHAERLVKKGNPQDIANTVWACASLGVESPNLFLQVECNINKLLLKGNMQELCNTCYAIVLLDLGRKHNMVLTNIWNRTMQNNGADLSKEELLQLAQVEAFAKAAEIHLLEPSPELRARMCSIADLTIQESRSQKEVSDILTELGFMHEKEIPPMEDWVMGSMLAIDMACRERKIAIEFDGPSHYLKGFGTGEVTRVENGATKAKRSFLERVGWKVININYHDWIDTHRRKARRKEWLKKKLSIAGISL